MADHKSSRGFARYPNLTPAAGEKHEDWDDWEYTELDLDYDYTSRNKRNYAA
jgi:hypothetical protein